MKSFICLLAFVAYASAGAVVLNAAVNDDGQWRPWLDGSILGASPGLATAALGSARHGLLATPLLATGHLATSHLIAKRSLGLALGHTAIATPLAYAAPVTLAHITPAAALRHDAQLVAPAVAHATVAGVVAPHLIAKRSLGAVALGHTAIAAPLAYTAPVAVARITPAAALRHDAQIVAPAVAGVVGTGLWGHGLVARHW